MTTRCTSSTMPTSGVRPSRAPLLAPLAPAKQNVSAKVVIPGARPVLGASLLGRLRRQQRSSFARRVSQSRRRKDGKKPRCRSASSGRRSDSAAEEGAEARGGAFDGRREVARTTALTALAWLHGAWMPMGFDDSLMERRWIDLATCMQRGASKLSQRAFYGVLDSRCMR